MQSRIQIALKSHIRQQEHYQQNKDKWKVEL